MPPRRRSGDDDFAPNGSDRTSTGLSRENLPPGRLNRPGPPANPHRGGTARKTAARRAGVSEQQQADIDAAREEARRKVEARRSGGRFEPIEPNELEPQGEPSAEDASLLDDVGEQAPNLDLAAAVDAFRQERGMADDVDFYQPSTAVSSVVAEDPAEQIVLLQQALQFGMRLLVFEEGPAGTWDDFIELAVNALMASTPEPEISSSQRFLYGKTGWLNVEVDKIRSASEALDVLNLGMEDQ